jgi:RND superfamily putative drug exporter
VILFGLSMDYEVFLMSRIREEWDRSHDPRTSVVLGVANTARVITTAALIMIAVYASFVTNADPTVKVMELFGKAAWWFPRWLEWIPHVNIEGTPEPTPEPEPEPEPVATSPSLDPSPTGS